MNIDEIIALAGRLFAYIHAQESDPVKDQERMARIDKAFNLANARNETPQSDLDHLSGRAYLAEMVADAPQADGGGAAGSHVAWVYAKLRAGMLTT